MIERTLTIHAEPLERILSGPENSEMRSAPARIQGQLALSLMGAKAIVGK